MVELMTSPSYIYIDESVQLCQEIKIVVNLYNYPPFQTHINLNNTYIFFHCYVFCALFVLKSSFIIKPKRKRLCPQVTARYLSLPLNLVQEISLMKDKSRPALLESLESHPSASLSPPAMVRILLNIRPHFLPPSKYCDNSITPPHSPPAKGRRLNIRRTFSAKNYAAPQPLYSPLPPPRIQ